jgi:hypothetical protein
MGYDIEHQPICSYQYRAKCIQCAEVAISETIFHHRRFDATDGSPLRIAEENAFTLHLKHRGWSIAPLLCPKCRARLVTNTIAEWLDDEEKNGKLSLALKGGDPHEADSNV